MSFLNKKISEFSLSYLLIFYLISVSLFIIFSSFYLELYLEKFPQYIDENNDIVLKTLPFVFGDLLNNLYYKNEYVQKVGPFETDFYLARLPFYPLFILLIAKINLNFYFIFFVKNIFSFSVIFFSSYVFLRDLNKSVFLFILFLTLYWYNPYNTHVLLTLDFSDTLISIFFPLTILLISSKNFYLNNLFGIFIFGLYLLKPSIWIFCIIFPVLILIFNLIKFKREFLKTDLFVIFCLIIAIFSWGLFGLKKANYFPIGTSSTSTSTFYLTSLLNSKFHNHYPSLSIDLLLDIEKPKKIKFLNEKEIYDYYKKKNLEFIKERYHDYFKGVSKKITFILFGIYEDGKFNNDKKIRYSNIPNKLIMIFALIYAFGSIINSLYKKKKLSYFDLIFLLMFFLYIAPHIVAWATSKHLVPLFLLSKIYIFIKLFACSKYQ